MADWRPFGYRHIPGTCRWCGATLRYRKVLDEGLERRNREAGMPNWQAYEQALVRASKAGGYQDGKFCGLRCGYQWAVRAA